MKASFNKKSASCRLGSLMWISTQSEPFVSIPNCAHPCSVNLLLILLVLRDSILKMEHQKAEIKVTTPDHPPASSTHTHYTGPFHNDDTHA